MESLSVSSPSFVCCVLFVLLMSATVNSAPMQRVGALQSTAQSQSSLLTPDGGVGLSFDFAQAGNHQVQAHGQSVSLNHAQAFSNQFAVAPPRIPSNIRRFSRPNQKRRGIAGSQFQQF